MQTGHLPKLVDVAKIAVASPSHPKLPVRIPVDTKPKHKYYYYYSICTVKVTELFPAVCFRPSVRFW